MSEQDGFQLIIAAFDDETGGVTAVTRLVTAFLDTRAAMPAAASIVKDAGGALTIRETTDIGAKQGAAAGAVAGGLIGLLSRKRGTVSTAALGALLGGVTAHKLDTGIPDPRLEAIGQSLDAASSAAVAVIRDDRYGDAKALLSGLGATVRVELFDANTDFVRQMQAGDYRGALSALANQAESMVAVAGDTAARRAASLSGDMKRMTDKPAADYGAAVDEEDIHIEMGSPDEPA